MAKKSLRTHRQPLSLDGAVVAGSTRVRAVVYGYRFPSRPDVMKIGYSSRGVVRIREQSTGFPETPQVVFVIHHPQAAEIERRIHQDLAHRQVDDTLGVEWFRVDFEDVVGVSAELRQALGRQRWKSVWRWLCVLCALALGALLAPVAEGLWRGGSWTGARIYLGALCAGDPPAWAQAGSGVWRLLAGGAPWEIRVLAVAPALVVVWALWRRS